MKKKISFIIITIALLLLSSFGIYHCYGKIEINKSSVLKFNQNNILYDIFDEIYPLSYQLDNTDKDTALSKYITANKAATNSFYKYTIIANRENMIYKKNIKYYAEGNNITLGNTNDNLKNLSSDSNLTSKYQWYLKISFDETGKLTYDKLGNTKDSDVNYELVWNNYKQTYFDNIYSMDSTTKLNNPTNVTIYFAVPTTISANAIDTISNFAGANIRYQYENLLPFIVIVAAIIIIYGLAYPYRIVSEIALFKQLSKIKLGLLAFIIGLGLFFSGLMDAYLLQETVNGEWLKLLQSMGFSSTAHLILDTCNILGWMLFLFLILFCSYYLKYIFHQGLINYLKNNTILGWLIRTIKRIVNRLATFDFNDDLNKLLLKAIILNAIIVSILCCFYSLGILLSVIYSIFLFIFLQKRLHILKHDYQLLLNAVKHLSNGKFDVEITEDLGAFTSLSKEFTNIKDGFEKVVNEEVKSQKMKTELISNVSHDLKTPLTSIITYIDLLKKPDLNINQRNEYLNTLDHNALRLKNLIDDLFEVSKLNSGNVSLNPIEVDIIALVKQAKLELDNRFIEKNLIFKTNYPSEKIILLLDSSKTYRIFENLLINISKYALEYTRVYIDIIDENDTVTIIFKNISAKEIKISENELVERFVQGDTSRNTGGSGLGLAIAKSFTELQNGTFDVKVDGDLFKVTVKFNKESKD